MNMETESTHTSVLSMHMLGKKDKSGESEDRQWEGENGSGPLRRIKVKMQRTLATNLCEYNTKWGIGWKKNIQKCNRSVYLYAGQQTCIFFYQCAALFPLYGSKAHSVKHMAHVHLQRVQIHISWWKNCYLSRSMIQKGCAQSLNHGCWGHHI